MPYVLKHRTNHRLYTCTLVNHYDLKYYGTKYWDDDQEAKSEKYSFLENEGISDQDDWEIIEIEDELMKLCNVKLKNDPAYRVYLDDQGRPKAER